MVFHHKFFLKVAAIGRYPEVEISEDDYKELTIARRTLTAALSIEEKYDLVIGNFLDLEKELVMLTIEKIVDHRFDYSRAYMVTSSLDRKIINFILSAKNYTELISSKASKCVRNTIEVKSAVEKLTNQQYETNSDYRFMEALRNHLTHYGDAVHLVDNPDRWLTDDNKQATHLVFNLSIYALKERLAENSKFKPAVLNEMQDKIDLKKAARSYIGAISSIQEEVREIIKSSVSQARSLIESHLERYASQNNGDSFAVGAYSAQEHKAGKKPTMLLLDWDDVRVELQQKNQSITNMNRRYISSAI